MIGPYDTSHQYAGQRYYTALAHMLVSQVLAVDTLIT